MEIGLPSHKRGSTLEQELKNVIEYQSRLNMELQIFEEEKNNLKSNEETMTRSYSLLTDNLENSLQRIEDLQSMNKDYQLLNEKLQSQLDSVKLELQAEKQQNQQYYSIITELKNIKEQYEKININLHHKNDQQLKQIQKLTDNLQQIEVAVTAKCTYFSAHYVIHKSLFAYI